MDDKKMEMYLEKLDFVKKMEELLLMDAERSGLKSLKYRVKLTDTECLSDAEVEEEYIEVLFKGGGRRKITATGNSNGANLKAVADTVY